MKNSCVRMQRPSLPLLRFLSEPFPSDGVITGDPRTDSQLRALHEASETVFGSAVCRTPVSSCATPTYFGGRRDGGFLFDSHYDHQREAQRRVGGSARVCVGDYGATSYGEWGRSSHVPPEPVFLAGCPPEVLEVLQRARLRQEEEFRDALIIGNYLREHANCWAPQAAWLQLARTCREVAEHNRAFAVELQHHVVAHSPPCDWYVEGHPSNAAFRLCQIGAGYDCSDSREQLLFSVERLVERLAGAHPEGWDSAVIYTNPLCIRVSRAWDSPVHYGAVGINRHIRVVQGSAPEGFDSNVDSQTTSTTYVPRSRGASSGSVPEQWCHGAW